MTAPAPQAAEYAGTPAVAEGPAPPSDATRLAERAVLGALLSRPDRLVDVQAWLQPHDFTDPQLQAVYETVQRLHRRGDLRSVPEDALVGSDFAPETRSTIIHNVLAVQDALVEGADAQAPRYADLMAQLYRAAPPSTTPQHARYGRMVLESSARRQIEQWAVHVRSMVGGGDATDSLTAVQQSDKALREALSRLGDQVNRRPGAGAHALARPQLAPAAPPPRSLVERSERRLIGAVLNGTRPDLCARFEVSDFTSSPAHANTWRAIKALASTQPPTPIDPITVAWEGEKLAARFGDGIPANDLSNLAQHPPGAVNDSTITAVAQAALYQRAQEAAAAMQAAANDRGQDLDDVMLAAKGASGELRQDAERLIDPRPPEQSAVSLALDGPLFTPAHHMRQTDTPSPRRPR